MQNDLNDVKIEKARENRLRRLAGRYDLVLRKSRARDPWHPAYGGYHLVDIRNGGLVCGWDHLGYGFGANLDHIEAYLTEDEAA